MTARASTAGSASRRQRIGWLIALFAGVTGFTAMVLALAQSPSEQFASQVQADLEWRALRGAQELAKASDLAYALSDTALFNKALELYATSPDIQALAVEVGGEIVSNHGTPASLAPVFAARPGTVVRGDGYVASWAATVARGTRIDKVGVVVSTRPLAEADALQTHVLHLTLIAGVAAAILGALAILWLTRRGVAQVSAPATADPEPDNGTHQLAEQLQERTRELDERSRALQLVLDRAAQGFVMADLAGRIVGPRSAAVDRWFGEPAADATLAGYLSRQSSGLAVLFGLAFDEIRDGVVELQPALDQLPRRLTTTASTFDVTYAPLMRDDKPERILVILSDVTEQVTRERKQREDREQREVAVLSQLITGNRAEFDEFFAEVAGLVASLDAPSDPEVEHKALRTLKESCSYQGLETYAELCQEIERALATTGGLMTDGQRVALSDGWGRIASQLVSHLA